MPGTPSAIPVGTQFSPDLIDLAPFIAALIKHSGDLGAMVTGVWQKPVRIRPVAKPPTGRRGRLPLEAAVQYGLLTKKTYKATELTYQLAKLSGEDLYNAFARHILLNLGGTRVVEAAQQMRMDSLNITGDTLARYLTIQGFPVTEHNTAINSLRMWLAKAGVFEDRWDVSAAKKEELLGLTDDQIAALVGLNREQQAFVVALCRINPTGEYSAAEVRNLAESIIGHTFARASLPKGVLEPLSQIGLIQYRTKGTGGGKPAILKVTPKFNAEVLEPFTTHTTKDLDAVLTAYYRKSPSEIYAELDSADKFKKGKALEAYAVHIMRLLGLRFVVWRKRAIGETGGAELDVLMTGLIGGQPSRWQIQCKNTPHGKVDLEDVAKEIGLLPLTKATHVMLLANCNFTSQAEQFAEETMRNSPVIIYLLGAKDFQHVRKAPGDLPLMLRNKAQAVARLRRTKTMWDV